MQQGGTDRQVQTVAVVKFALKIGDDSSLGVARQSIDQGRGVSSKQTG